VSRNFHELTCWVYIEMKEHLTSEWHGQPMKIIRYVFRDDSFTAYIIFLILLLN
jgi:hypothetical protein